MDDSLFSDQPAPDAHLFSDEPLPKNDGFQLLSSAGGAEPTGENPLPTTMPNIPNTAQQSDAYPQSATEPVEERLANNFIAAGNGAGMFGTGALKSGKTIMDTVGQYAKRFGQNQAMKSIGAAGGQIGQVGIPESRAIAQMAIDKGIVSPFRGPIGLEEKVDQLHKSAGADIGAMRKAADTQGTAPSMTDILQAVKAHLEPQYASGANKGMSNLNRAREEIAKGGTGTFTGNAQKATDLNAAAKTNALYRPQTATTDTADLISRLNNEAMAKTLNPAQLAKYNTGKQDYSNLDKLKSFIERGERKELSGRGGSASVTKALADKTMDMLGNRVAATGGNALGNVLRSPTANAFMPTKRALATYLLQKDQEQH